MLRDYKLSNIFLDKVIISYSSNNITLSKKLTTVSRTPRNFTKRGPIREFSWKSRQNLLRKISLINLNRFSHVFFITLTFQSDIFGSLVSKGVDFHRFFDLFQKKVQKFGFGIYRKELTKRGVLHYHFLFFSKYPNTKKFIIERFTRIWIDTIENFLDLDEEVVKEIEKMRKNSVDVKIIHKRHFDKVFSYVSKYMAKSEDKIWDIGRFWGVINKSEYKKNLISHTGFLYFPVDAYSDLKLFFKAFNKIFLMKKYGIERDKIKDKYLSAFRTKYLSFDEQCIFSRMLLEYLEMKGYYYYFQDRNMKYMYFAKIQCVNYYFVDIPRMKEELLSKLQGMII